RTTMTSLLGPTTYLKRLYSGGDVCGIALAAFWTRVLILHWTGTCSYAFGKPVRTLLVCRAFWAHSGFTDIPRPLPREMAKDCLKWRSSAAAVMGVMFQHGKFAGTSGSIFCGRHSGTTCTQLASTVVEYVMRQARMAQELLTCIGRPFHRR